MIKAIETRYAGCRFRSRLEARWAVFFDHMKIEWQYEPQGFELPSGPYLPDFYLPRGKMWSFGMWVEVKGQKATAHELRLAAELTEQGPCMVSLLQGDIPRHSACRLTTGEPALKAPVWGLIDWEESDDREWKDDIFAYGHSLQAALDAARSARFEHGQRP